METKFVLEDLLNTDISPYLNKDYIDMLNKLDDLNKKYEDVYLSISEILDRSIFDDLYKTHMAMAAAFDSSRLGLKGKERIEILEKSYQKKYKTIENHIKLLKEDVDLIDLEYIKRIHSLLSNPKKENKGNFRTIPRYRRFNTGKILCSTNIEEDLNKLIEFINNKDFGKYTLVNVAITQLAILSITPFDNLNRFVSITIADKLMEKHYGKPIYMETVLYRIGKHKEDTIRYLRRFWKTGDFSPLMKIYIDAIVTEMDSNIVFLDKLEKNIKDLYKVLINSNIKQSLIPQVIRFLIINNSFKIRDLHNTLDIKDRRTSLKIADELEKLKLISNLSDTHIKKYKVNEELLNDFKLMYKIKTS